MTRIFEINKLLFFVQKYTGKHGVARNTLLCDLRRIKLNEESSNYRDVLDACQMLNLVTVGRRYVRVTNYGMFYLELMTHNGNKAILNPNSTQKKFLLQLFKSFALSHPNVQKCFEHFQIDFSKDDKIWFATREAVMIWDSLVIEIGLVRSSGERLEVDALNSSTVSKIKNKPHVTEDELTNILKHQQDVGRIAEDLTVDYERKRLTDRGRSDMALEVQKISSVNSYAGYDVLSFDGGAQSYVHDRKIEVKGTSTATNRFYWSKNEVRVAQKYGDGYWIYLWKHVGHSQKPTLQKIQNPYHKFFIQKDGAVKPTAYEVRW